MWIELAKALCLVLVIEGLLPAVAPARWRRMVATLAAADDRTLRAVGLASMIAGAAALILVNRLS
ncbi:MAG: hypothetical protein KatS3mg124_0412 [Porticoccaceae bacterium]|nr:MAG: hypothetical protein KatS3mg124_0412 [Porticoccaceae bacterium]